MAELVSKLRQQLDLKSVPAAESAGDERDAVRSVPESSERGSGYWRSVEQLLHFGFKRGDTSRGQFRTRRQEVGEFFQGLAVSRVVIEVGTHSAWVHVSLYEFFVNAEDAFWLASSLTLARRK